MTPSNLMICGALVFAVSAALHIAGLDQAFMTAVGGALLFGKGYGVWEERQSATRPEEDSE